MRQAIRSNPRRQATVRQVTLPSPVGGLNDVDSLVGMPPGDALILDNYIPRQTETVLRPGYTLHVGALPAAAESLLEYAGSGRKLFAAAGTSVYDVTDATSSVGAAVLTSTGNARFQSVMFTTPAGDYLVMVNGAAGLLTYNGAGFSNQSVLVANASNFVNVASWKRRLWFVPTSGTKAWYLGADSIAGTAAYIELGNVFREGGNLISATPLSRDSGDGLDDLLCFISDQGEVAVFQGTDPASASSFALVGRYKVAKPLGYRSVYYTGGDAYVLTDAGAHSLLGVMQTDLANRTGVDSARKIRKGLASAASIYRDNTGWETFLYPRGYLVMINVPQGDGSFVQYVADTHSGSWCRFTGINAYSWGLLNQDPYFGASNAVYRWDSGYSDGGNAIEGSIKWAPSTLKTPFVKQITHMRPQIESNGDPAAAVGLDVDFSDNAPSDVTSANVNGATWDSAIWDSAVWAGGGNQIRDWTATTGFGVMVSPRLRTRTVGLEVKVKAVDLQYQAAGSPVL